MPRKPAAAPTTAPTSGPERVLFADISADMIDSFRTLLPPWADAVRRDLPWRSTGDPWPSSSRSDAAADAGRSRHRQVGGISRHVPHGSGVCFCAPVRRGPDVGMGRLPPSRREPPPVRHRRGDVARRVVAEFAGRTHGAAGDRSLLLSSVAPGVNAVVSSRSVRWWSGRRSRWTPEPSNSSVRLWLPQAQQRAGSRRWSSAPGGRRDFWGR